jgi:hypothetical protein
VLHVQRSSCTLARDRAVQVWIEIVDKHVEGLKRSVFRDLAFEVWGAYCQKHDDAQFVATMKELDSEGLLPAERRQTTAMCVRLAHPDANDMLVRVKVVVGELVVPLVRDNKSPYSDGFWSGDAEYVTHEQALGVVGGWWRLDVGGWLVVGF